MMDAKAPPPKKLSDLIPALAAYLTRVRAEERNFRRFVVKETGEKGYPVDLAVIKIDAKGKMSCSTKEHSPTKAEQEEIEAALAKVEIPKSKGATPALVKDLKKRLVDGTIYEFYSRKDGTVIMVQQVLKKEDGSKLPLPWSFWSDAEWRCMEPDGLLPFWKPRERRNKTRIMIHEGAKAASYVDELVNRKDLANQLHPWIKDLARFEHWGMIGGALSGPRRADFDEIRRENPDEVVYVCDNDDPGTKALAVFSQRYAGKLRGVMFGSRFPESFDLADPIPADMFEAGRYKGPRFAALIVPATWATKLVLGDDGKSHLGIRQEFADEWVCSDQPEACVHRDFPDHQLSFSQFNKSVRPFSDTDDTVRLLKPVLTSSVKLIDYRPDLGRGVYEGRVFNTYVPSPIPATAGEPAPFEEFMRHLIPFDEDRLELERWVATLIDRPDIRMVYSVLLTSQVQGVGKGTLGEKILAPLVGENNVSFPSESDVVEGTFNYWAAHKRLAVVHEIYAGGSSKAYHKLKTIVTDQYIPIKRKYMDEYTIQNWLHIFACSNSERALKLSGDDRRWFVPGVTDEKRDRDYWLGLNSWLATGGLGIIRYWAHEFLKKHEPVSPADEAPMTKSKLQAIEEGFSPGQRFAANLLDKIKFILNGEDQELKEEWRREGYIDGEDAFVLDLDIVALIKAQVHQGRTEYLEKPGTICDLARARGFYIAAKANRIQAGKAATAWGGDRVLGARVIASRPSLAAEKPTALAGRKLKPIQVQKVLAGEPM